MARNEDRSMKTHIRLNLRKIEHEAAWNNLREPANERERRIRMDAVESGQAPSALELILAEATEAKQFPLQYLNALRSVKASMEAFWKDPAYQHPTIRKKDISHNRRIVFNIEQLLFPTNPSWVGTERTVHSIYPLDCIDVFVLLCSVYIHDYGKGQFKLVIPELPAEQRKPFIDANAIAELHLEPYNLLESYHTWVIDRFLACFLKDPEQIRESLQHKYVDKKRVDSLSAFIAAASETSEFKLDQHQSLGSDAALAQKRLFWVLWTLRSLSKGKGRNLIAEIQEICRSHKAYSRQYATEGRNNDDFFDHIPQTKRVGRLAALLRLGDNLDLTRQRLEDKGELPSLFHEWKVSQIQICTNLQRVFVKWLTFSLVQSVHVDHRIEVTDPRTVTARVILTYQGFPKWPEHLLEIRGQVEKDFLHTAFLQRLESGGPVRVQLQLLYQVGAPTSQLPEDLERRVSELSKMRTRRDRLQMDNRFRLLDTGAGEASSLLKFSPLGEMLPIPATHNLLYLISFLEAFGRTKVDSIAKQLGASLESLYGTEDGILAGDLLKRSEGELELTDAGLEAARKILKYHRATPGLLREKVREAEEFGYILPFNRIDADAVGSGISGLDKLLNPVGASSKGFHHSRNILIVGGPGTGKTTFLVQMLHWNALHAGRRALMLTFEELIPVLTETYRHNFGWQVEQFVVKVPIRLQPSESLESARPDADDVVAYIHQQLMKYQPDLVAIDGLSRLRWMFEEKAREVIARLFKSFQIRGITSISSIEEPMPERGPAEEYQADCVIHLNQSSRTRELEITKLRSQDFTSGLHAFEILNRFQIEKAKADLPEMIGNDSRFPFAPGINVYPNEQFYATRAERSESTATVTLPLRTGIENLDELLPGAKSGGNGYRTGDSILVMGSPGAGKTLFGLHFLKAAYPEVRSGAGQTSHASEIVDGTTSYVLWVSFEGPRRSLETSVASFDRSTGLAPLLERKEFIFHFVPPAVISPTKVLFLVTELVEAFKIRRVVIDSISEIHEAFHGRGDFRQYMTSFIHALARADATSMFLHRVSGFFQTTKESESDVGSIVDTIISIKTFDMKNQIRRGLFVLKSRGRELRSQLQTMTIEQAHGIKIRFRGWEMEGLLSGETGNIHEPEVFLKHFYENPAERELNRDLVAEFRSRYARKGRFTHVQKPAIYSEFWSFRGNYGAGHANIRVVSVSRYMVEAFRELDRLHELDDFFPETLKEQIRRDPRWERYSKRKVGHPELSDVTAGQAAGKVSYDTLPMYTDLGLLVGRKDLIASLIFWDKSLDRYESVLSDSSESPAAEFQAPRMIGWNEIKKYASAVQNLVSTKGPAPAVVFALPYLSDKTEFMAFFFEVLWSCGGDVYHFPIHTGDGTADRDLFYKYCILGNKAIWTRFSKIARDVIEGVSRIYTAEEVRERSKELLATLSDLLGDGPTPVSGLNGGPKAAEAFAIVDRFAAQLTFEDDDIVTINNKLGRQALEFFYDLVFDNRSAVPNPYDGDFRDRAVYSRRWYSQIQDLRDRMSKLALGAQPDSARSENNVVIMPLPYFVYEKTERKRSCTTENVWCIGMVKEALSPEIGWIYIDTLTSPEWVKKRADRRRGFPFRFEEMKSLEHCDPDAYRILQVIVKNKQRKDQVYEAQVQIASRNKPEQFRASLKDFFQGEHGDRDVGDLIKEIQRGRMAAAAGDRTWELELALREKELIRKTKSHASRGRISELPDFESNLQLRSKVPASRPFFHRVESILHAEIVSLFSPRGRGSWAHTLTGDTVIGKTDEQVDETLSQVRRSEKSGRRSSGLIATALKRMEERLVFDLLTTTHGELRSLWPMIQKLQRDRR